MQLRFAIVMTSVAGAALLFGCGVVFGLGVLLSPPAGLQRQEAALAASPGKPAQRETTAAATHDDNRSLTPIYPTRIPGTTAEDAQATQQAQTEPRSPQPSQQAGQPVAEHAKAEPVATARPATEGSKANAMPVALEKRYACDVDACARAYHSFRANDCTYQPYDGPRQLCTHPPRETQASRATVGPPRVSHELRVRAPRGGDLDAVAREVERMTGGAGGPVEVIDGRGGVAVIGDDQ